MESWKDQVGKNRKYERGLYMGDEISNFYLRSLGGLPKMQEMLHELEEERRTNGRTRLEDLSWEITLCEFLIRDAMEDYARLLASEQDTPRSRHAYKMEIDTHVKTCTKIKQTAHEMKHSPKYTVPVAELEMLMQLIMRILMHRVKDPEALRKIANDLQEIGKTRSLEMPDIAETKISTDEIGVENQYSEKRDHVP